MITTTMTIMTVVPTVMIVVAAVLAGGADCHSQYDCHSRTDCHDYCNHDYCTDTTVCTVLAGSINRVDCRGQEAKAPIGLCRAQFSAES
jgi:hypothetical protein